MTPTTEADRQARGHAVLRDLPALIRAQGRAIDGAGGAGADAAANEALTTLRRKWFRLVTPAKDNHGTIILPDGGDLSRHRELGSPWLWGHASSRNAIGDMPSPDVVVGHVVEYRQSREALDCLVQFDEDATDPSALCNKVWRKVEKGLIRACSVGMIPLEAPDESDGVPTYRRWQLLEGSVVIVGSNPQSLVLSREQATVLLDAADGDSAAVPVEKSSDPDDDGDDEDDDDDDDDEDYDRSAAPETREHFHHGKSRRLKLRREVASVAVQRADGRVLLGRRTDSGKWHTPGGHAEPGERLEDAARRELREETGLDRAAGDFTHLGSGRVEIGGDAGAAPDHYQIHAYRVEHRGPINLAGYAADPDAEFDQLKWFRRDELKTSDLHAPHNVTLHLLGWLPGDGISDVVKAPPKVADSAAQPPLVPPPVRNAAPERAKAPPRDPPPPETVAPKDRATPDEGPKTIPYLSDVSRTSGNTERSVGTVGTPSGNLMETVVVPSGPKDKTEKTMAAKLEPMARSQCRELIAHHLDGAEKHAEMRDGLPMEHAEMRAMHRDLGMASLKHAEEIGRSMGEAHGFDAEEGYARSVPESVKDPEMRAELTRVYAACGKLPRTVVAICRAGFGTTDADKVQSKIDAMQDDRKDLARLRDVAKHTAAEQVAAQREDLINTYSAADRAVIDPARAKQMRGIDPATGAAHPDGPWSLARVQAYIDERKASGPVVPIVRTTDLRGGGAGGPNAGAGTGVVPNTGVAPLLPGPDGRPTTGSGYRPSGLVRAGGATSGEQNVDFEAGIRFAAANLAPPAENRSGVRTAAPGPDAEALAFYTRELMEGRLAAVPPPAESRAKMERL